MNAWGFAGALALAGLLGGGVGGWVVSHSPGRESRAAHAVERGRPVREASDDEAEESDEVTALRDRITLLERRVSLLTLALTQREPSGDAERADEAAEASSPGAADVSDPVFEAAVLDIVDRQRERTEAERETRRTELQTQRTERITGSLAQNLGLDDQQKERVGKLVTEHFEALRVLRSDDSPSAPVTPREMREKTREIQKKLEDGLKDVLTSAQMTAYEALDPDDRIISDRSAGRSRPRNQNAR